MESEREAKGLERFKPKDERLRLNGAAMASPQVKTLRGGGSFRCS